MSLEPPPTTEPPAEDDAAPPDPAQVARERADMATGAARFVRNIWRHYFALASVARENDELNRELARAVAENNRYREMELAKYDVSLAGYMMRAVSQYQREWSRISRQAVAAGFSLTAGAEAAIEIRTDWILMCFSLSFLRIFRAMSGICLSISVRET